MRTRTGYIHPEEDLRDHHDFLTRYIDEKYFGQVGYNAGVIFAGSFLSWAIARMGGGFAWIIIVLAFCGTYYRTSIRQTRLHIRDDINREMQKARLETDTESAEWINTFLVKFWVIYEPVLSATIVASVDQVLATTTPAFLDSLRLSKFTLGTKPPRIEHVKTYPKSEDEIVLMDWKFSFTPNDTADLTTKQLRTKVNPKVVLAIRVGKGVVGKDLPILVEDISFSGLMRVKIRLMSNFPHVQVVDLSFLERPEFDYILKPIGGETFGFDIGNIPGLSGFIKEQVHANLGPMMYAPNVFTLNIEQMLTGDGGLEQANGVLHVTIHNARGLKNPDKFSGTPDPYVCFAFGTRPEVARTQIMRGTSSPRFNETKFLLVNNVNEAMNLDVYDYNDVRKDRKLGTATFDLKSLEETPEQENLLAPVMYNGKPHGEISFDISYYPVLTGKKLDDGTEEPPPESNTGIVRFTVHAAKDLDPRMSMVGTLSPYAALLLNGREVHRTAKMKRTNAPVWEDSFEFLVSNRLQCRLGVIIKDDRDLSSDPAVGSFQMKLDDILEEVANQRDWYSLSNCAQGRVRLSAKWKPVEMPGGLQGTGGYIQPIGVMRFELHKATNLLNVEALGGGKSDPYLRILVSNIERARTVTISNNLDPVWEEVLYVPVRTMKEKFVLEVMDYEKNGRDRSLGFIEIIAADFVQQGEDGYYLENSEKDEQQTSLVHDKKNTSAVLYYNCAFYPSVNVIDPEEEEEEKKAKETEQEKEKKKEIGAGGTAAKSNSPEKNITKPVVDADGKPGLNNAATTKPIKKEPVKVRMPKEELLENDSGIFIFKIIDGHLSRSQTFLEVLFDDLPYPVFTSTRAKSSHMVWDEMGDAFIRELQFSRISLRLRDKENTFNEENVIASVSGETFNVLKNGLGNPMTLNLKSHDGASNQVKVKVRYLPVKIRLDPSESMNNMGSLKVDLIDGKSLPAADRSGKSDPYCKFILNEEKVYQSETKKKTLNPVYNESFEVNVPSRTAPIFFVEVYDWDFGGSADFLGSALIDLSQLEPFKPSNMSIPLNGKSGQINLRLLFRPAYVTRTKRGASTTFSATRTLTNVAGAPMKGVGAAAGVGVNVAGGAVQGVGKTAAFVKGGFLRNKSQKRTSPAVGTEGVEDRKIVQDALLTNGGVKGNEQGDVIAVTGDSKETYLGNVPSTPTSKPVNGCMFVFSTA